MKVFTARVTAGRLVYDRPLDFARHLLKLEGEAVEVTASKPKTIRSVAQNRAWFGLQLPVLAEELGWDRHERLKLHYELVKLCFGFTVDAHGLERPNKRSSELTTVEFSELMEWAVRWGATEYGIRVPLPNEVPEEFWEC